jgi:hypothetical protein
MNIGDDEFRKFLEGDGNSLSQRGHPLLMAFAVRQKCLTIEELYRVTLENYSKIDDKDPLKDDMRSLCQEMIADTKICFDQYDFVFADLEGPIPDDGDEEDDDDPQEDD